MVANNEKQMVFNYDNSITVSNGQQLLPVMSARQPIIKFIHPTMA